MKNNVRRIGIFAAALLCAGFLGAGVHTAKTLEANAATEVEMTEMTYGAALRLGDHFGLRFQMTVNQEWFDSQENAKVRMLLIREAALTGELTKDTAGVYGIADGQELINRSGVGDVYQYNAVIVDIPDYAYDQPIVARGCIELSDGSYVYTDATTIQTRSVVQVANSALLDQFDMYYGDLGKYTVENLYVNSTAYAPMEGVGTITPWIEYFDGVSDAVRQQLNEKTAYTFSSSDADVLTVDETTGEYKAVSAGTATVTVSAWGKTAECEVTVDANATYVTDQSITVPTDWADDILGGQAVLASDYKLNGTSYAQGATVPLGDGLLVTSGVQLGANNLRYTRWTYPNAIDLNGKTSSDIILDLSMLPSVTGAREVSYMDIQFTDTVDSTNSVRVRLEKASNANWNFSVAAVAFSTYPTTDYFRGLTNGTSNFSKMWIGGDIRGNMNIALSFDYANKAIYSYYQDQTRMQVIADLDNTDHFPEAQWSGFTIGKAYVSVTMYGVATTVNQTQMLVRTIGDYDLQTGESNVALARKNVFSVDVPEGSTYYVDEVAYTDSIALGEGLVVTMTGDTATWTYPTAFDFSRSTSYVDIMTLPQTALTREFESVDISFTDADDPTNVVTVRVKRHPNSATQSNYENVLVAHAKLSDYPTADYWRGWTNGTNYAGGMWLVGDINGSKNIRIAFDYENRVLSSWYDVTKTGMATIIDLDNTDHFPEAQWSGFTNGKAYVSITLNGINTSNSTASFFVRELCGADLLAPMA